jgi:hypothetical protein
MGDLLASDCVKDLMANPVLALLLRKGPIDDLAIEGVLTSLRRICLLSRSDDSVTEQLQSESPAFLIGLAQQCFHNEYVYEVEPNEAEALARLREIIEHGPVSTADTGIAGSLYASFPARKRSDVLGWRYSERRDRTTESVAPTDQ